MANVDVQLASASTSVTRTFQITVYDTQGGQALQLIGDGEAQELLTKLGAFFVAPGVAKPAKTGKPVASTAEVVPEKTPEKGPDDRDDHEEVLFKSYQHFNNGGLYMRLIRHTSYGRDGDAYVSHFMETELRNMGLTNTSRIAILPTTIKALEGFIAAYSAEFPRDPNYLRPIEAELQFGDSPKETWRLGYDGFEMVTPRDCSSIDTATY